MTKNSLLTETEERQIEKKFELIQNCDSNYVIGHLKKNKMLLKDIINICEHLIMNYDEMLNDIEHHDKLSKDFYRKPDYGAIKDEYHPIISKRLGEFNRLSKSLNKHNKKTELALNKWITNNISDNAYLYYSDMNDFIKNDNSVIGWITISTELSSYTTCSSPKYDVSDALEGLFHMYELNVNLTDEFILEVLNTSIDYININCSLEGLDKFPYVYIEDGKFLWDI